MKRCTLLLLGALLAGCSPTESDRQQAEANARFDAALQAMARATSGTRHTELNEDSPPLEEYRRQQLREAAEHLQPVAESGPQDRRFAARKLVGEVAASQARHAARQAMEAWSQQTDVVATVSNVVTQLNAAQRALARHAQLSYDQQLQELRQSEQDLLAQRQTLNEQINELEQAVQSLRNRVMELEEQRRQRAEAASQLYSQAFQAEGQEGYDLTVRAAMISREADQLSKQAETLLADLSVRESQLAVLEAKMEGLSEQLEQTRQAVESLNDRAEQAAQLTDEARQRAAALAEKYDGAMQDLASIRQTVNERFAEVDARFGQALAELEAALQAAPMDGRDTATLTLNAARVEYGHLLRQQQMIHMSYGGVLDGAARRLEATMADRSAQARQAADEHFAAAIEANNMAQERFAAATEPLQTLLDRPGGDGQEMRITALRLLVQINDALAGIALFNGDQELGQQHQTRAEELRQQLQQLRAGDEEQ